ncbi:MAG: DM13 domain-containing protein [Kordiimonadaceae bacterium]|nr:DM13 domain-containing protein [Kordiimonadaceae bacterium]MBO6569225.1 DM13 domain-containing protein [Kordiimonadaceae bacterium]MBO6964701.1 DM13 domain-containing protein [Kordiimonadaceae bacterium]
MFKKLILTFMMVAGLGVATANTAIADDHASTVAAHGTFEGRSDHVTTGGVSIVKTASGYVAVLESDFSLDGAPDPTLGFGNNGKFDTDTLFTKLESKDGLQVYAIPANIDVSSFSEFYVWCEDFSVPLGVASLK